MATQDQSAQALRNSTRVFNTLKRYMEDDDWYPKVFDDAPFTVTCLFAGEHGRTHVYVRVLEEAEFLRLVVHAPFTVPQNRRHAVARFITRANYGLNLGAFQLDLDDGELSYRSALDFEGLEVGEQVLRSTLVQAVLTMDDYLPGLMAVIYGGVTPEEAILIVESDDDSADLALTEEVN